MAKIEDHLNQHGRFRAALDTLRATRPTAVDRLPEEVDVACIRYGVYEQATAD